MSNGGRLTLAPEEPVLPCCPVSPGRPLLPGRPSTPRSPGAPANPWEPCSPGGPGGPKRSSRVNKMKSGFSSTLMLLQETIRIIYQFHFSKHKNSFSSYDEAIKIQKWNQVVLILSTNN